MMKRQWNYEISTRQNKGLLPRDSKSPGLRKKEYSNKASSRQGFSDASSVSSRYFAHSSRARKHLTASAKHRSKSPLSKSHLKLNVSGTLSKKEYKALVSRNLLPQRHQKVYQDVNYSDTKSGRRYRSPEKKNSKSSRHDPSGSNSSHKDHHFPENDAESKMHFFDKIQQLAKHLGDRNKPEISLEKVNSSKIEYKHLKKKKNENKTKEADEITSSKPFSQSIGSNDKFCSKNKSLQNNPELVIDTKEKYQLVKTNFVTDDISLSSSKFTLKDFPKLELPDHCYNTEYNENLSNSKNEEKNMINSDKNQLDKEQELSFSWVGEYLDEDDSNSSGSNMKIADTPESFQEVDVFHSTSTLSYPSENFSTLEKHKLIEKDVYNSSAELQLFKEARLGLANLSPSLQKKELFYDFSSHDNKTGKQKSRWDYRKDKTDPKYKSNFSSLASIDLNLNRYSQTCSSLIDSGSKFDNNKAFDAIHYNHFHLDKDLFLKKHETMGHANKDFRSDVLRKNTNLKVSEKPFNQFYRQTDERTVKDDHRKNLKYNNQEMFESVQNALLKEKIGMKTPEIALSNCIKQFSATTGTSKMLKFAEDEVGHQKQSLRLFKNRSKEDSFYRYHKDMLAPFTKGIIKNDDEDSIDNFKGAWKAATNSSIKLPSEESSLYASSSRYLGSESEKTRNYRNIGDQRISVLHTTLEPTTDKRHVLYSSRIPVFDRVANTQQNSVIQHHDESEALSSETGDADIISSRKVEMIKRLDNANDVEITTEKESKFWEKYFVNWFSKHILPTQTFKMYLEHTGFQVTASRCESLPYQFLQDFEKGNQNALNCVPKNHKDAQVLYSYLSKYRLSNGEPFRKLDEKVKSSDSQLIALNPVPVAESMTKIKSNKSFSSHLVHKISQPAISSAACSINLKNNNAEIPCRNPMFSGVAYVSSGNILPKTTPLSQQFSTLPCVSAGDTDSVLEKNNETPLCVNSKWNAEVQQFIGRTKSSNSRPAYIEYLERTAEKRTVSEIFLENKPSKKKKPSARSPSTSQRRKISSESAKQHYSNHKRSNFLSLSPKGCARFKNRKDDLFKSRKPDYSSTPSREIRRGASTSHNVHKKVSTPPKRRLSSSLSNKPKLVVQVACQNSSRKVSSIDLTRKLGNDSIKSGNDRSTLQSFFGTTQVKKISADSLHFNKAEMDLLSSANGLVFQQFIKDEAINVINFYYSFEKYNQKKIKDLAAKVCQEFKSSCSWSLKQATYFIKMLFKENSHQPFQVNLKKRLDDKGNSWHSISSKNFIYFQKEISKQCDAKLNKRLKYTEQNKDFVLGIIRESELVFPQFCGDASNVLKMWVWKKQAEQFQVVSLEKTSSIILKSWKDSDTKEDSWMAKVFRHPPFNSTNQRCIDVISILKSGHNMSINSAVDRISTWWLQLYYEWKYRKAIEEGDEGVPELVVLDEAHSDEKAEDSDVLAASDSQDPVDNEYSEDASGAPTILLF